MYSKKKVARRRWPVVLKLFIAVIVAAGLVLLAWIFFVKGSSSISNTKNTALIKAVKADQTSVKTWEKPAFVLQLPEDWEEIKPENGAAFQWRSKKAGYENRWVQIYVDKIPEKRELNRVMPVEVVNNKLLHGILSENCKEFTATDKKVGERALENAPGIYEGITFNCDLAKPRNVIGILSKDGGYKTQIKGESGQKHAFFIVYTDHSTRPDYEIMYEMLNSFFVP